MSRLRCLALFLLTASLGSLHAFGQANGVIQGVIVDPQGAVVVGAKVRAVDEEKNLVAREVTSGTEGRFQLRSLLPGRYTIEVENAGFKKLERKGLVLDANQIMDVGLLPLQMGTVTETVDVSTRVEPLVQTADTSKSFVISHEQVTELSLNGRDFQALMSVVPGVTSNSLDFGLGFSGTTNFNVNGSRNSMNNVFLDGVINTDQGDNGSQYTQLSLDAVGEFKVQTGVYNAEYGRNPGVVISANTKSGGDKFHGTLYEFLRNDALDANSFFRNLQGLPKAPLRFNQFGGNLGGPIPFGGPVSHKLFFFFNYEGTRGSQPRGGPFADVPDAASLTGDFRTSLQGVAIATAPQFDVGTVFVPGTITRNAAGKITGGTPFGSGCTTTFPVSSPNCNVIPQSSFNQNAAAFLKILGEANRAQGSPTPGAFGLVRVPVTNTYRLRKNQEVARIDYLISPSWTVFFRWVNDTQHEENGLGLFSSTPYPVYPYQREKPGSSWSWNLVKVISPAMTNEFIFAFDHQTQGVDVVSGTDPSTFTLSALGFKYSQIFPAANLRNRFPAFNCAVGPSCNFGAFPSEWQNEGKDYGFTDNFTFTHKTHAFKTGIYFNLDDKQQQPAWNDAGSFDFGPSQFNPNDTNNGLANLLLGNYSGFSQSNGKFLGSFRFIGLEFYGQDSWKVSRRLTLEFGARYAYLGPTNTRGQFLENYFNPALYNPANAVVYDINNPNPGFRNNIIGGNFINGIVQENSGGIPAGFAQHRKNQVSPRFGFAYDPFGDGKTAIRGGFGTFYERIRQNVNSFDALGNPPLLFTPQFAAGNIDGLSPALVGGGIRKPVEIRAFDQSGKVPTIYAWSFGIQRQIGARNGLDVSYVGNMAHHLQLVRNINLLPLGTTTGPNNPLPAAKGVADAVRPFLGYTAIDFTGYDGNSNYHALQTRFTRRFAANLTGNVSYTWSKAIDQADTDDNFNGCGYFLNCARERGPAGFDRTHLLDIDYVYQLPKVGSRLGNGVTRTVLDGWELSGVTRFWSGTPFTVGSTGNPGTLGRDTGGGVRADHISGQPLYPANQTRLQWFNPFAFQYPLDGTLGNTGRNMLRGPSINNWNVSVFKNTKFTERVSSQLRFEFFNIFNHTQFAGVSTSIGNKGNPGAPVTPATVGTTGQITSARDPRNIQVALKLYF